jgi:hypothetical protein
MQTPVPTTRAHSPVAAPRNAPNKVGTENANAPPHQTCRQRRAIVPAKIAPTMAAEPTNPALKGTAPQTPGKPPTLSPQEQPAPRVTTPRKINAMVLVAFIAHTPDEMHQRPGPSGHSSCKQNVTAGIAACKCYACHRILCGLTGVVGSASLCVTEMRFLSSFVITTPA